MAKEEAVIASQDNIAVIANKVVSEKTYTLGGVLGDEIKRLGKEPEDILPFSEATILVPQINKVELLPFQSPAFRLTRTDGGFHCQAQYTSSSAITETFPWFGPENLFASPGGDLRSRYLLAMGKMLQPNLMDEYRIDQFLLGTSVGNIPKSNLMLLRIPTRNKVIMGLPSGEFATARAKGAPLIITTDTPKAVDFIATYIGKYRTNGLNALLAILLSKQLTLTIEQRGSTSAGTRYNLFYCFGQNYSALQGSGTVLDASVDLVPTETGGFKFEKMKKE